MTTVHTYVRCVNKIYVGDANDNWRELHSFETEKRAKRWQRDQEKQRPGSVTAQHHPPQRLLDNRQDLALAQRKHELNKLIREQRAEMAREHRPLPKSPYGNTMSGKTAKLARAAVAPDHDGSSFLRERSKKRVTSRNARNTRATFGAS